MRVQSTCDPNKMMSNRCRSLLIVETEDDDKGLSSASVGMGLESGGLPEIPCAESVIPLINALLEFAECSEAEMEPS